MPRLDPYDDTLTQKERIAIWCRRRVTNREQMPIEHYRVEDILAMVSKRAIVHPIDCLRKLDAAMEAVNSFGFDSAHFMMAAYALLTPSPKSLTIAIDYDETWTKDRAGWAWYYFLQTMRGHKILFVTSRRVLLPAEVDNEHWKVDEEVKKEVTNNISELLGHDEKFALYFTEGESKQSYLERQGWNVDFWADDSPGSIIHGK